MDRKSVSMTDKRKVTPRHEVDIRPLSEWLRDAWRCRLIDALDIGPRGPSRH
jgi:hypothetical protein